MNNINSPGCSADLKRCHTVHLNDEIDNFTNEAVDLSKTHDCFIDISPGTSKYCNCHSNSKIKDDCILDDDEMKDIASLHSIESIVCRICHNSEDPDKLVSPCLCKGSLTYVHINCLERWISMSRCTICELCQFQYSTEQTLRYSLYQSLRMWYSRSMSRRALQEDCQMFSLLTLVAFGIVGTLFVAVQYYILQGNISGMGRLWTKGWLIFFLFTTLIVYLINVYMIVKSQLMPWYRWWQSARDIRLNLVNQNVALKQTKNDKNQNLSTATTEESISQTNKILCHQQNRVMEPTGDDTEQCNRYFLEGNDVTCQNITTSLAQTKIYNNQTEVEQGKN
ncbi:E3 ubiquitin-protein ligase MARCHF8 [Calliphora vicina]|uniref:E3 ubiquitin-protein ligase MARCHF8 n=1 Tax=Calliphora vicina TaxID=7373 RepID=UPI00325B68BF